MNHSESERPITASPADTEGAEFAATITRAPETSGDQLAGLVLGDFALLERIGSGSFGDVYRAWQRSLDREAVIKVARNLDLLGEEMAEQFLGEAKLASQLDHPYAAHIYAFGHERQRNILWIAMEFIRGVELKTYLEERGRVDLEELVHIFEHICEVVHTAHEIGIVHRDLKPANIMLIERAGRRLPKLLDFGVAKLQAPLAETSESGRLDEVGLDSEMARLSTLVGTPAYMSPEQWRNSNAVDARSDVYALGVILYQCITGERPFSGKSLLELQEAHCHRPVPAIEIDVPQGVRDVVMRALAKDPDDRFPHALAFSEALTSASGLQVGQAFRLPKQADGLRARWIAGAPQPIAESLSLLNAARSAREARELTLAAAHAVVQYLGLLALSSASRIGWERVLQNPRFADAIVALDRHGFTAGDWLELAREICRPFVGRRQAFSLPALVDLFFVADAESGATDTSQQERELPTRTQRLIERASAPRSRSMELPLGEVLADLAELLQLAHLIVEYPLIYVADGLPELWVGTRQPRRQVAFVRDLPDDGRAVLFDLSGNPVLDLHPFLQVAEPAGGEAAEVFFLDSIDSAGMRLVALPVGYEFFDKASWAQLRRQWTLDAEDSISLEEEATPFRGLDAFRPQDAAFFFGREKESHQVRNQLRRQSFVAVVGASGSGKSSFVHAGVIAHLPADWRAVTARPGADPLAALAGVLSQLGTDDLDGHDLGGDELRAQLLEGPEYFGAALREHARAHHRAILVFIDQLEELFTLSADPAEQAAFSHALMSASRSSDETLRVVVTLRDDFLARAGQLDGFRGRLGRNLCLLTTPSEDQLRRIVTEPIRRLGYKLESPAIVDDILEEVADRPGSLPLLSFAGSELWSLRDRHFKKITRGAYESIGGVVGSLARYAETELESMSVGEQRLVREAFRHLVTSEGTRAVVSRAELLSALDQSADDGAGAHVIERLLSARLLVAGDGDDGEHIEIIHEALLSAWPRLVDWQREDSESARLHDQLRSAARQWIERERPRGLLWRGDALAEYRVWRSRFGGNLTALEHEFSQASIAEERRGRRFRRSISVAIVAVLVTALIAVLWMYRGTQERLYASYEEGGRRELVYGRPIRALKPLLQAYRGGRQSAGLRFSLARASNVLDRIDQNLIGHERTVFYGVTSPDDRRLVTTDGSGHIHTWDPASGELLHRFRAHDTGIVRFAVAPDWSTMATLDHEGMLRVWRPQKEELLQEFAHGETALTLEYSSNGRYLATKTHRGITRVRDLQTGGLATLTEAYRFGNSDASIVEVAFCAGDTQVLVGNADGQLRAYSPAGESMWSMPAHPKSLEGVECMTRKPWVITGGLDQVIRVWQREQQTQVYAFQHPAAVRQMLLAPTEKHLLTLDSQGAARLWNLDDGQLVATMTHGHDAIIDAAFDDTGRRVLTVGITVALWHLDEPSAPAALFPDHGSRIRRASFFGQDKVFTFSEDSTIRVWHARDPHMLGSWRHAEHRALSLAVAPAGDLIAAGFSDKSLVLYKPGGQQVAAIALQGLPYDIDFDRTGQRIVVASSDGAVQLLTREGVPLRTLATPGAAASFARFDGKSERVVAAIGRQALIWNVQTGATLHTLQHEDHDVSKALFAGATDRVVTASGPDVVFWSATTGEREATVHAHGMQIYGMQASQDGRFLATSGEAATVKIWNVEKKTQIALLEGHSSFILDMDFGYGDRLLATTGVDQHLMFWNPYTGALLDKIDLHEKLWHMDFADQNEVLAVSNAHGVLHSLQIPLEQRSASELSALLSRKTN